MSKQSASRFFLDLYQIKQLAKVSQCEIYAKRPRYKLHPQNFFLIKTTLDIVNHCYNRDLRNQIFIWVLIPDTEN